MQAYQSKGLCMKNSGQATRNGPGRVVLYHQHLRMYRYVTLKGHNLDCIHFWKESLEVYDERQTMPMVS